MASPTPREMQIERDWQGRIDHARAMYYMAVAAAEKELDAALERADTIRTAELAKARHEAHGTTQVDWAAERQKWQPGEHDFGSGRLSTEEVSHAGHSNSQ